MWSQNGMCIYNDAGLFGIFLCSFVHLFLNGLYWGVYNRCERPDAKMSERLFGGDADNYSTIKHYNQVSDGNGFEYRRLIANVSNLTYEEVCKAVDMPAYIDYLLVENVIGNREWPDNNFIVTHSPKDGIKCHFFAWDCETAYDAMSVNYVTKVPSDKESSPQNLHVALMQHEEYRREYSRHARKHLLEPGGSLTVEAITNHIAELAATLRAPLRGESSRWGTDALMEGYDGVVGQLLGNAVKRHATFVAQLQSAGLLLPDVSTDGLEELDPMVPMDPVVVRTSHHESGWDYGRDSGGDVAGGGLPGQEICGAVEGFAGQPVSADDGWRGDLVWRDCRHGFAEYGEVPCLSGGRHGIGSRRILPL